MTGLIIVLAIMLVSYFVFKIGDVFSPWFITTGVWFVILLLFTQYGSLLYPLEDKFFYCVWIWVPILSVSSILTYYSLPDRSGAISRAGEGIPLNKLFFMMFFLPSDYLRIPGNNAFSIISRYPAIMPVSVICYSMR